MHVDGNGGGPPPVPRRRWTNHYGRAEMSDEDSEDFPDIKSESESNGEDSNVGSVQNQIGLKWEI